MKVLLSNDDGIRARGLRALYAAFREAGHEVCAVAPMRQQSGVSRALTVFEPLRAVEYDEPDFQGLGVYGTPADCVKLGLGRIAPWRPDLVAAGINAGPNAGPDIGYSGTVAAAAEAACAGLPSLAVSHCRHDPGGADLLPVARHAVALAERMDWAALGPRRVLNVNYPDLPLEKARGLRVCPRTRAAWTNAYGERRDPRGARYWWLEGEVPPADIAPDSDKGLLAQGWITLTPLCFELDDAAGLAALAAMRLG